MLGKGRKNLEAGTLVMSFDRLLFRWVQLVYISPYLILLFTHCGL